LLEAACTALADPAIRGQLTPELREKLLATALGITARLGHDP